MNDEKSLHNAIYEGVALSPYDPKWPSMFEVERSRLFSLFPDQFAAIEHFGSTAVPGLSAKPIIDILAGVESMSQADSLIKPLCRSKFTTSAEFNATLQDRRWLMRWADGHRTHHLHLVVHGGSQWQRRLAFRDALRSNEELAKRYEQLKKRLVAEFSSNREAYTEAKAEFVREVLECNEHNQSL
ncbi:GrpB family protein [Marinobacter algicola]|uniref:Glutamate-rich protein grpB n=1 Tax=Marinobacter algicola DG893 TaxID=443152 RepID=A6EY11_9GAMM|nr:GrpB family protein [Marinobacter algicola]EDM48720.1 Glutamate-rich protein grpB [Marinobacter algicola DG893]